jgi:uracil-DNA glycosylase family 4
MKMPIDFNAACNACPYIGLSESKPLSMENNESDTLLIFQSPGKDEWDSKQPISSANPKSTAHRIRKSLLRINKERSDYNITNAVQCYPGISENNRDNKPDEQAINACSKWLKQDVFIRNYRKVVIFGEVAKKSWHSLSGINNIQYEIVFLNHPSGGLSNDKLDRALQA